MKIFKGKSRNKSWSLSLVEINNGDVAIRSVDSNTGEYISTMMLFLKDGRVMRGEGFSSILKCDGYDPGEHNNTFDEVGRIVISEKV